MAKTESQTACFYPIVAAVQKADDIIGRNHEWQPNNQEQMEFLIEHYGPCAADTAKISEIQSIASFDANEINKWLAERNFGIKLKPFEEPNDFGTASILDVLVEWLETGKIVSIQSGKKEYPGVRLGGNGVSFFTSASSGHSYPLVQIQTKSKDLVYLTMMDQSPKGADLLAEAESIVAEAEAMPAGSFEAVRFPMVKLDQEVNISWLKKMWTRTGSNRDFEIKQAVQQTKIAMNERGARAKSAVAIGISATSVRLPPPEYTIDKPFLFVMMRPGLARPLIAAKIERPDWKNPGDLANL